MHSPEEDGRAAAAPTLEAFPVRTVEKVRYADTDRQGHVNNAVFASFLETGRVELLCHPRGPLHDDGAGFVIARLVVDFRAELVWPGAVDIGTRVVRVGTSSVTLEQGLFQDGRCAATARTVIVHVDDVTKKSKPLREASVARLSALVASPSPGA